MPIKAQPGEETTTLTQTDTLVIESEDGDSTEITITTEVEVEIVDGEDEPDTAAPEEGAEPATTERRKLERGRAVDVEEVKGSLSHHMNAVYYTFYNQIGWRDDINIFEVFANYVIVSTSKLPEGEYYLIPYVITLEGKVEFSPAAEWEIVELVYQPVSNAPVSVAAEDAAMADSAEAPAEEPAEPTEPESTQENTQPTQQRPATEINERGRGERIVERMQTPVVLEAQRQGRPRTIEAKLFQAGVINENDRRYPEPVVIAAVNEAVNHLRESLSQGRAILLGEDEHPSSKGQPPMLREVAVVWTDLWYDESDKWVKGKGRIIETSLGRDLVVLMEAGVLPSVSLRGYGEMSLIKEQGRDIYEVEWLRLTGFDLVMNPGFAGAEVTLFENKQDQDQSEQEEKEMANKNDDGQVVASAESLTLETLKEQNPDLYEAVLRQAVGATEGQDPAAVLEAQRQRLAELEEKERKATVAAHVAQKMSEVKFEGTVLESFQDYMNKPAPPATVEEADARFAAGLEIFKKLAASERLGGMGYVVNDGLEVKGPVSETQYGIPAYALAARQITEAMRRSGDWMQRQPIPEMRRSFVYRDQYLRAFDEANKHRLAKESQEWQEAMTSTPLELPYSVLRAIVDEAFPQLITPNVFDIGVVNQNPISLFYEAQFTAESGLNLTVTDEDFYSAHDEWVSLAGHYINIGSVVIKTTNGATTYTEGVDYLINPLEGLIKVLSTGSMADNTEFHANYTYSAIRKGENATIERAKSGLANTTLTLVADRLATEITDETITFSQSQLGYDAVRRTINLLVKEVMKKRDAALLYMALSQALSVASNSGGTWTSASDDVNELVEKIGVARVKLGQREYTPTAVVMSLTNADRLSNSDLFSAAGSRPDASIDAQGFAGRIKGLPVYWTNQFADSHVLVVNRELLMFRTMGNMRLEGPFHTIDVSTGKMLANKQWYVQEYSGVVSPIAEKGSYVVVA